MLKKLTKMIKFVKFQFLSNAFPKERNDKYFWQDCCTEQINGTLLVSEIDWDKKQINQVDCNNTWVPFIARKF